MVATSSVTNGQHHGNGIRPIDRFISQLAGVKRSGSNYQARCPAHEDRKASLSVKEGDDRRVLLLCRAGCETTDVLAAMGLSFSDLYVRDGASNGATNGHSNGVNPSARNGSSRQARPADERSAWLSWERKTGLSREVWEQEGVTYEAASQEFQFPSGKRRPWPERNGPKY